MDKVQLYFQQLKEKLAYRYFFSMSDEESYSESDFALRESDFRCFSFECLPVKVNTEVPIFIWFKMFETSLVFNFFYCVILIVINANKGKYNQAGLNNSRSMKSLGHKYVSMFYKFSFVYTKTDKATLNDFTSSFKFSMLFNLFFFFRETCHL